MTAWLTIVGIGEEEFIQLADETQKLIANADILVGGVRHLKKVKRFKGKQIKWDKDLTITLEELRKRKDKKIVILSSGDPMEYGVGATISRYFPSNEVMVIPSNSAFSLAAAKMLWPLSEVTKVTLHGRPLDNLNQHIVPNAKILALSWDGSTPKKVSKYLTEIGFGESQIYVFEHLGGKTEKIIHKSANDWSNPKVAALNTIAIECKASEKAIFWPRVPGLPEEAFEHDGMITKKEIRAITIAALEPMRGRYLWDVGAGCGAISIEWLRSELSVQATAIEQDTMKCNFIKRNASKLGVSRLVIVQSKAPDGFSEIVSRPDVIFVGGGISNSKLLTGCWDYLKSNGSLVANAVSIEGQANLMKFKSEIGGELTSMSISRSSPVGKMTTLRPMISVLQLKVKKK